MADGHSEDSAAYEAVRDSYVRALLALDLTPIAGAAQALAPAIARGGLLWTLGTGHSQIVALEGFYRAGAPAWVAPLVDDRLSAARGVLGTAAERTPGLGSEIADRLGRDDGALLVVSTSGVNAVPVEAAARARERGLLTIAITARGPRNRLATLVDHVLDTGAPAGDASVLVAGQAMAPLSTVAGAVLLHALLAETERLLGGGNVLASVNVPDRDDHNRALLARYPHLQP